jgi:hypothetical protein
LSDFTGQRVTIISMLQTQKVINGSLEGVYWLPPLSKLQFTILSGSRQVKITGTVLTSDVIIRNLSIETWRK